MFNEYIKKYYDASTENTGQQIGDFVSKDIPIVGGLLGGGISLVSGLFQKKKANALLKQNPYPNESIPVDELANQQQAQRMADEGMPSAQYQQAQKNIQRQQAAAIAASQDRRSGTANIGAIQAQTNDATGNLDAQSAAIRRQNQLNLQGVNSQVAGYRQQAWDWNYKQKYLQNYQYGMSLLGQGNADVLSGADKILGGFTQGAANGLFSGSRNSGPYSGDAKVANDAMNVGTANTSSGGGSPSSLFSTISTLAPLFI